jgi:anti-anti-sigma factor
MITLPPRPATHQVSGARQTQTSFSPNAARLRSIARNVVWVDLSAHVNISSSSALHDLMNELLGEWHGYTVIVSFSDVIHVDSTGLGVLLSRLQRMRKQGSAVSIACDDSVHRSMLELSDIEIIASVA